MLGVPTRFPTNDAAVRAGAVAGRMLTAPKFPQITSTTGSPASLLANAVVGTQSKVSLLSVKTLARATAVDRSAANENAVADRTLADVELAVEFANVESHAVLDHDLRFANVFDPLGGIAVDQQQIGQFARLD